MADEQIAYMIIAAIVYGPHIEKKEAAGIALAFIMASVAWGFAPMIQGGL